MSIMNDIAKWLATAETSTVVQCAIWDLMVVIFGLLITVLLWLAHVNKDPLYSKFNLAYILTDVSTGEPNGSKIRILIGSIVLTWGFVYLTIQGKLTEFYAIVYAGTFISERFLSMRAGEGNQTTSSTYDKDVTNDSDISKST